ncbi:MAG: hypothetical protein U0325_01440 [Polyangiales bacterium]
MESDHRLRVDAFSLAVEFRENDGTTFVIAPTVPLRGFHRLTLPLFASHARGELVLRAEGIALGTSTARLAVEGVALGAPAEVSPDAHGAFRVTLRAPLGEVRARAGAAVALGLALSHRDAPMQLLRAELVALAQGPVIDAFDLREATDSLLVNAPERKLFDLQNPEEGFWVGTGRWRLRLLVDWLRTDLEGIALDPRPSTLAHNWQHTHTADDVLWEDSSRRAGGRRSYTELSFDTSNPALLDRIPPEGMDLPVTLTLTHALERAAAPFEVPIALTWSRDVPLRLRDPRPLLPSFRRLSGVGIDFGTTATVAAFSHKGFRALMRLGAAPDAHASPAENPTVLLIDDHERLWSAIAPGGPRFPNLLRVVQASHAARERMSEFPNAVVTELKSLPERVMVLDQPPQLRDREKRADFLLDEPRVRALIRTYGYLLGRAINRPGQEVFLRYFLTQPAEFDERARELLVTELRAGIALAIPEGIADAELHVELVATEPEAYAAEVCPELAAHPAFEPLLAKHNELRFAVFDFGGGTLDIACGRYRPATPEEERASGCSSVIETLQVAGDDHLGGDYLTHELVWLTHQHEAHLPEMEAKEVPMQRPVTVPENRLARAPQLYKRSLAARQNKVRFEKELGLERVKFKRANEIARLPALSARRLDESEVTLESLGTDVEGVQKKLAAHLEERIRDGAKRLANMIASTPWTAGAKSDDGAAAWRAHDVVILLAGNSSRGEYVERALAQALGVPALKVWHPGDPSAPQGVVLFETPSRMERGAEVVGVSPKTAVALGALRIANRDVHLVRAAQGFSYFVGDLRGFPPRFHALIPMGATPAPAADAFVDFGPWNGQKPLRLAKEFEPGRMVASDPRVISVRPDLPPEVTGQLLVCPTSPSTLALRFVRADGDVSEQTLNLAPYFA